jgi:hypothetical protein
VSNRRGIRLKSLCQIVRGLMGEQGSLKSVPLLMLGTKRLQGVKWRV